MNRPIDMMLDRLEWKALPAPANDQSGLPYATHEGVLKIGDAELKCYVLSDGRRVFTEESVLEFFGGMA